MDKKRIALIVGFIALSLLLGYGLYRVFFASNAPGAVAPAPTATGGTATSGVGQFPQASTGRTPGTVAGGANLPQAGIAQPIQPYTPPGPLPEVKKLVPDPVVGAVGGKSGAQFYNQTDGKFYRIGPDGKITLMSDQVFYNVNKVTWSPNQSQAVLEYPDGSNIAYDFVTKKQITLPKQWQDFSFSPEGTQIAAKSIAYSPENSWLVVASPDGSNVTPVAALGNNADKVTVNWSPNNQIVALSTTGDPLGGDRQQVLFVGLHGENFPSTVVEGRDLRSTWSTDGAKLLYSVYSANSDFKPELWVVNASGGSIGTGRQNLGIDTWADKCAFGDGRYAYCGVPDTLDQGAGFAPTLANNTPDHLIRIDTQTGLKSEIPMQNTHVIDHISIAPDGKSLYFTDKTQNGLFTVNL